MPIWTYTGTAVSDDGQTAQLGGTLITIGGTPPTTTTTPAPTTTTTLAPATTTTAIPDPSPTTTTAPPVTTTTTTPQPTTTTTRAPVVRPDFVEIHGGDRIPNFGKHPTIASIESGMWSDAGVWDRGRVPGAGDVVEIAHTVFYDVVSDAVIKCVSVVPAGLLIHDWAVSTRLTLQHLLVHHDGFYTVGTILNPIGLNQRAEVIFADVPLDLVNDPQQWGNGLLAMGTTKTHGYDRGLRTIRLAEDPPAGTLTLRLTQPATNWQPGDQILLSDTRSLGHDEPYAWEPGHVTQTETVTLASVSFDGLTLTLNAPTQWPHKGAEDGARVAVQELKVHAVNLTSNVIFKSANPTGTRGHLIFTGHRTPDWRHTEAIDLGRTTNAPIHNTLFNADGTVNRIGTNQIGRYWYHCHGVHRHTPDWHAQFHGCVARSTIRGTKVRHGFTLHHTNFSLLNNCVSFQTAGWGFGSEAGTEVGNEMWDCYACSCTNLVSGGITNPNDRGGADVGYEPTGFWLREASTILRRCVSADTMMGFLPYTSSLPLSLTVQANREGTATRVINPYEVGLNWEDCESYGGQTCIGFSPWEIGAYGSVPMSNAEWSIITRPKIWNTQQGAWVNYKTSRFGILEPQWFGVARHIRGGGFGGQDYIANELEIVGGRIEGFKVGISPSTRASIQTIRGVRMRNFTNIQEVPRWGANETLWRLIVDGCIYARMVVNGTPEQPQLDLKKRSEIGGANTNLIIPTQTFVFNHNGVAGDHFQLFWNEQHANHILPQTEPGATGTIGSPEAGLTNLQNKTKYHPSGALKNPPDSSTPGICWAAEIAPADAITRAGIYGLVAPIPPALLEEFGL